MRPPHSTRPLNLTSLRCVRPSQQELSDEIGIPEDCLYALDGKRAALPKDGPWGWTGDVLQVCRLDSGGLCPSPQGEHGLSSLQGPLWLSLGD